MKKFVLPLVALLIIAGVSAVWATKNLSDKKSGDYSAANESSVNEREPSLAGTQDGETKSPGRYGTYAAEKISASGYETTVLFFHAAWCPECRAFKNAITSNPIPEGVQVLEVDYDTSAQLKKMYGITLQSTFVKVDNSGKQQAKWVGYGKDKNLQTILSNL